MADKTYDMESYKQSGAYQSLGIDKLQEQLAGYPVDEETLRKQAEAQYKPTYDAELEGIRQQRDQQIQGYNSQLAGLGTAYDSQRRQTNEGYDQSAASLSNALTRRGLGRSSLVSTQGAYLEKQRGQALSDINARQTAEANAINEKIALLTDQAAQSENRLNSSYASQLEARINELRKENQGAATNLQLQIAALQQEGYNAWVAQQNADREYEFQREQFEYQKKRGSGSGSSSVNQNPAPQPELPGSDDLMDKFIGDGIRNAANWAADSLGKIGSSVTSVLGNILGNISQNARNHQMPNKKTNTSSSKSFQSAIKK